jgi:hypothetical protein
MNMKLLFVLLLLPGLAHAVICKTVGEDGVDSFADVPAAECPQGSRIPEYSRPAPVVEQAGSVNTGVSARQVEFAGYESIEIVNPAADGTVRSNEGRVPVIVELEPGLQQSHFITAYLDGKAFRGRYGSSQIELTGVDRGTHKLYVKVQDSKGKTLIKSRVISFTVHQTRPEITVNPITGDDYIGINDPSSVPVRGMSDVAGPVILRFPGSGQEFGPSEVSPETQTDGNETYNWEVLVPRSVLEKEASFEARAGRFKTISTHSVDPKLFSGFRRYEPNWTPPPANYTPSTGGIPTTPGQTNPGFTPKYTP